MVVEAESTLRDELHDDRGHEGLGDARDAEHGVGIDRARRCETTVSRSPPAMSGRRRAGWRPRCPVSGCAPGPRRARAGAPRRSPGRRGGSSPADRASAQGDGSGRVGTGAMLPDGRAARRLRAGSRAGGWPLTARSTGRSALGSPGRPMAGAARPDRLPAGSADTTRRRVSLTPSPAQAATNSRASDQRRDRSSVRARPGRHVDRVTGGHEAPRYTARACPSTYGLPGQIEGAGRPRCRVSRRPWRRCASWTRPSSASRPSCGSGSRMRT